MITDHSVLLSEEVFKFCGFQCNFRALKLRISWTCRSEQAAMEATSMENCIKYTLCRYEVAQVYA